MKDISVGKETNKALKSQGYAYTSRSKRLPHPHFAVVRARWGECCSCGATTTSYAVAPVGNTDQRRGRTLLSKPERVQGRLSYANAYGDNTAFLVQLPQLNGGEDRFHQTSSWSGQDFAFRFDNKPGSVLLKEDRHDWARKSQQPGKCVYVLTPHTVALRAAHMFCERQKEANHYTVLIN